MLFMCKCYDKGFMWTCSFKLNPDSEKQMCGCSTFLFQMKNQLQGMFYKLFEFSLGGGRAEIHLM